MDSEYLNMIEEIMEKKRQANPLNQEISKLFNKMYPSDQFYNVFKLGYVHALSTLKNDVSKYFCKDCNEYLDMIIKVNREDETTNEYFEKLLK